MGSTPIYKTATGRAYPFASAYCYGLRWRKYADGMTAVGHTGGLPGFGSEWTIYPEYGIGIVSFANLTYANAGSINVQAADTLIRSVRYQTDADAAVRYAHTEEK